MASTSIQTVPSSFTIDFPKPQPEYDIFLSFRGEDTRCRFTDHLYHALVDKKIITYKDDKELKMGEPISLELLEAIEKSRIAVIIFSENYASSTWCLEELTKIVECKDRGILTVLPIFYHVEPTDVRHQKNTFAEAFAKHEKCFEENPKKVQKWRAALTNVANLSGERLKDGVHEANFIQSIVQWIYSKLKEKRSNDIEDDLVGISSRVEEIISYLDLESTDVHFIGIYEKSGMGKTTLAQAVFDKILNQFEACSFLENVREESKAHGLRTLQKQLLCDIGKGGLRVKDEHKGMQVISDILHNKKVLIVVDDVSEKCQLEKLVGKRDLFGKGSRIIVTTEDKELLASYEIKIVYKARGLNEVEALQLFSLNAFHRPHCENDFLEYCNNFVEYAQRIPLVLKVLGSYLCTRTKNEWESAQNQLRAIPHEKTTKKLRIAFDGLGAEEKKLFLDIACFFKGEEKNRVADILESVYFPDINLKNLIDKSLITLVGGGKLWMHNLLQQMGWEIVSEESEEARERSRLWHCDDVLDVLKNNTGTKHIEGMLLRLPPDEEEELNAESFSKMNKLRLLRICKVRLSCLNYLSNELCLLEWHDYPLESLPNSFQPGELVELIMHRSCLQQLPSEFSKLGKLKLIDLSDSQNLTRIPDFTGFSNIERLNFQGCTRLHELHPSVGGLKRLILLNLKDCKCLKNLPYELNLESLKTLILSGCSRFKKFPRIGRNMRSLLELYLDRTAIEELPPTIRRLTGLTLLNLQDCKKLKSFPSDIHSLTSLEILTLSGCKCQPPKAGHLLGLSPIGSSIGATLTFPRLISFLFLSFLAWRYTYLRIPVCATIALSTYCFHNARHSEPEPINLLLSNSFSKLSTLVTLSLSDCNLLALPDDPSCLSSIEYLNLSKNNFICLPDYISQLSKLKILFLDHCSKLKSLPYVPLITRLVSVQGCTSLENYSNQVVVWTLGVAGFTIITCLGLAEDEDGTIAEVSLLDIHLLWQRYVKDQIHQMEGFCHFLPQIEIPEWFKHQRPGSFGPIPLSSNLFSNKNWKGIALCVIFEVPAYSNDVSPGEDTKYFHEFYCRLDINGDLIAFKVPKETYVGSFGLWLYISHARFRKHLGERSCITPLIGTNSPDIEIKMCGARILYKQDVGEFLQNLGQKIFVSPINVPRGELKSQLSRLYQVDRTRNHLSDFIFPQNASPPRSFAFQNGPAIKTQLPADMRPTPVTKLLLSNETIQGECTSRETIFSNQVIAAGTSKSSRQGSIYLGKISFSLECLQDHYEGPGTHNQCLPQSEIPGWFKSENIARSSSVTIQLPLNLYENLEWMGFAFCAVFSFQKHPTSVPMKGSECSFIIVCHLKTNLGCMNPLYSISEKDVIISLHQRGFLWLSFIPCWFLSPEWSRCTSVEFSFVSNSSAVSALKCGVDLVYRQKLEFTRRMVQCITSYDGPFTSYKRFPFYHPDQFSGSDGSSGTSGHYSYDQFYKTAALDRYNNLSIFNQCIPQSEISEWFSHDSLPSDLSPKFDFHPSTSYNFCFPPSKIQDWFSHPNHGHSVTIDLPSNLYHDSNWMGLVLYASFSIHGDPNIIFSNLVSGKSHLLYCQCQTSMANVDNQKIAFSTNKEEIMWLLNLDEFIWICYIPGEPFKNMLPHCSHIGASFESDWPGVIVQNCALQLLYQHDQVQFEQELKHCNNLISQKRELVRKQLEDEKKINEQYHVDERLQRIIFSNIDFEVKIIPRLIDQPETDDTKTQLAQSDLLENQEKVDKWRVTSKEVTKISVGHLEKSQSFVKMLGKMEEFDQEKVIEEFEALTKDAERVQRETLEKILEENGSAEYLQSLGLNGRTDIESFRACVPLVTYQDLEYYILRIVDGDSSPILTEKPITTLSLSSGTTQGKPKFVPFNDKLVENTLQIFRTSFAFRNREFPLGNGRALQFLYSSKQFKTKGGLAAGTATANVFSNSMFKKAMKAIQSISCSPDEVIFGPDFHQSLYCHLLCGLIFRDEVQFISSAFAHSIIFAFRTFEQVWEELCNDIRTGVLSSRINVPSTRTAMSKLLKPNPVLADLIYKKCSSLSNWYGLIPELLPNAKYIHGVMTGSMEPYLKKLRHYAGGLPLLSADYGASEGWIGANVNPKLPPELATYAVLPNIGYFEFIPLGENIEDQDHNNMESSFLRMKPMPVGLTKVKIGEEYEVLVTNFAGLYRYRLGDVVKVIGFHNSTPEIKFVCRRNLLVTMNTEKDLQLSVEEAGKLLSEEKLEVVDFSSHVDLSTDPGHYVIFWEISGEASQEVLKECCNCLDKSLVDAGYVSSRKVNSIGALELRVVRRGTFQKILDHYIGLGSAVSQFKTPRFIGRPNNLVLQILCANVVKSYFSTAF